MNAQIHVFRVLTVGWMALIFLLSSQSSVSAPMLFSGTDKLLHALCYGILGFFLARSFVPPIVTTWNRVLLVTALVTAYGIADEYHQWYVPRREASGWDALADGVGGFIVTWTMLWRHRHIAVSA